MKNNNYIKLIISVLFVIIIISAFYLYKNQKNNQIKNNIIVSSFSATTTITLPISGYSTKIIPIPPVRSLTQLLKEAKDFGDDDTYSQYYTSDIEKHGDLANRFIDKSLGISEVRKFDVDMDGKDETVITLCDYVANGCPAKFIIVKDNKVIFTVDQGYRHLNLIKSETGNGFTIYWTPIAGTTEEMERLYCCPIAHMETTFIYKNGTFKPVSEQKVNNIEEKVSPSIEVIDKSNKSLYIKRNYEKEFECDSAVSTNESNACTLEKFSRASAIREWKQRKLENLKYPEINVEKISDPVGDSLKIKKWREGFDKARDLKCEATVIFRYGSGSSGGFSYCGLKEEIDALKVLDFDYYEVLLNPYYPDNGIGIPNFEPTEKDIKNIMKTIKYSKAYDKL